MIARLTAAAALLLAVPGTAAAAPVLEELRPCYASAGTEDTQREGVDIRGAGFTPEAAVEVLVDGAVVDSGQADVFGNVSNVRVIAPYQARGERPFSVSVREVAIPTNIATVTSRVTSLSVSLRPKRARPSRRVRYRGSGFMDDAPVFAHYIFNDRVRKTVRLARRSRGPCGRFSVKRRQIPVKRPRTGEWLVQIDQRRKYDEEPGTNWVHVLIDVRRDFRDPAGP